MKLTLKQKKLLFISIPAILVLALLVMMLAGVFAGQQDKADTTFERPFIRTSQIIATPASLSDLLNAPDPSLDILLRESKLTDELLAAGKLTDVVNSRLSLSSLRTLRDEAAGLMADREKQASLEANPDNRSSGYILLAQASATDRLAALKGKMDQLLSPQQISPGLLEPLIDLRGVWTRDENALLRWTPHETWIPDQGYSLYRTIGSQTELIAADLGSAAFREEHLNAKAEYAQMFTESFGTAALSSDKLSLLGIAGPEDFEELAYTGGTANSRRERVSGELDFQYLNQQLLTVPGTLAEKLPANDAMPDSTLQIGKMKQTVSYAFSAAKISNMAGSLST